MRRVAAQLGDDPRAGMVQLSELLCLVVTSWEEEAEDHNIVLRNLVDALDRIASSQADIARRLYDLEDRARVERTMRRLGYEPEAEGGSGGSDPASEGSGGLDRGGGPE